MQIPAPTRAEPMPATTIPAHPNFAHPARGPSTYPKIPIKPAPNWVRCFFKQMILSTLLASSVQKCHFAPIQPSAQSSTNPHNHQCGPRTTQTLIGRKRNFVLTLRPCSTLNGKRGELDDDEDSRAAGRRTDGLSVAKPRRRCA